MLAVCAVLEYIHTNTHIHKHPRVSTRRRAHMCHTPDTPTYMTNTCQNKQTHPCAGLPRPAPSPSFLPQPSSWHPLLTSFLPPSLTPHPLHLHLVKREEGAGSRVCCVCVLDYTHTQTHTQGHVCHHESSSAHVSHTRHTHMHTQHTLCTHTHPFLPATSVTILQVHARTLHR